MRNEKLERSVVDIIKEQLFLAYDPEHDRDLQDLGADSIDMVELACELENAFGISIPDEQLETGMKTVGDVIALVERLTAEKGAKSE